MDVSHVMVAADVISDVGRISKSLDTVLKTSVLSLLCTLFVIMTGISSKRVGPTLVAAVGAAAVWFVVMNMTVFREKTGETLDPDAARPPAAVVTVHDTPAGGRS